MTPVADPTARYQESVNRWILESLEAGALTFEEVVRRLPGVYPGTVSEALHDLQIQGVLPRDFGFESYDRGEDRVTDPHACDLLPVPHPLDYDWRFSLPAIDLLARKCEELVSNSETIALFGTPSLVLELMKRRCPGKIMAVDANPLIVRVLRDRCPGAEVVQRDLVSGPPLRRECAGIVVADPPWYPEQLHSFLWASAHVCKIGGQVLISLPPIGTRPGIPRERASMLRWARRLGLRVRRVEEGILSYASPPFEQNALRAAGLGGIPLEWRHGDLAVFDRQAVPEVSRPRYHAEDEWCEESIHGVRIKMRREEVEEFRDPSLRPIVPGDILPTVSRRDPRRACVDVWTSGNRVFGTLGPATLFQIVRAIAEGEEPTAAVERWLGRSLDGGEERLTTRAAEQLSLLVERERADA